LGQGIPLPAGTPQKVKVVNPRPGAAGTATTGIPGPRPGFGNNEDPASAPSVLDFEKTSIILKDLPDKEFRDWIIKVQKTLVDLGLNRGSGSADYERLNPRAEAYLDVVTWDPTNRATFKDSSDGKQSSCGMFIRDLWWLCGARGGKLMDEAYHSGIITSLLYMGPGTHMTYHPDNKKILDWNTKAFLPRPGDVLALYEMLVDKDGNPYPSNHIFSIIDIDKDIALEGGQPMIRDRDGERGPADVVTFTSIDGGQADGGGGQDSKHKYHENWGCNAIKTVTRQMKLKAGRWPAITAHWPIPNKAPGRPISGWIPIGSMQHMFTAPLVLPHRKSSPMPGGGGATGGGGTPAGGTHAENADPQTKHKQWDDRVDQHQADSMQDLLNVFASAGYKETLDNRNWYTSPDNPKKEAWGPRPRIAMDAILHKNEGDGARWVLDECERAGLVAPKYGDQYNLIKSTLGIVNNA